MVHRIAVIWCGFTNMSEQDSKSILKYPYQFLYIFMHALNAIC